MSIPGKERKLIQFCTDSRAHLLLSLQMGYANESELMHQHYLLVWRGIGWLGPKVNVTGRITIVCLKKVSNESYKPITAFPTIAMILVEI